MKFIFETGTRILIALCDRLLPLRPLWSLKFFSRHFHDTKKKLSLYICRCTNFCIYILRVGPSKVCQSIYLSIQRRYFHYILLVLFLPFPFFSSSHCHCVIWPLFKKIHSADVSVCRWVFFFLLLLPLALSFYSALKKIDTLFVCIRSFGCGRFTLRTMLIKL